MCNKCKLEDITKNDPEKFHFIVGGVQTVGEILTISADYAGEIQFEAAANKALAAALVLFDLSQLIEPGHPDLAQLFTSSCQKARDALVKMKASVVVRQSMFKEGRS